MILGEGALGLEGGEHGQLRQLGKAQQLAGGVGIEHALAHMEEGVRGGEQDAEGRLHVIGIGTGSPAFHR